MTEEKMGSMFVIRGDSQLDVLQPGKEALVDLGFEVLAGTVIARAAETFEFRPWGRPQLTISLSRVKAAPIPDHALADRSAAIERQRLGYSAAPPACDTTPNPRPQRQALPITPQPKISKNVS